MRLSATFGLAAAAATTFAAPTESEVNGVANMMVKGCTWTIENFSESNLATSVPSPEVKTND